MKEEQLIKKTIAMLVHEYGYDLDQIVTGHQIEDEDERRDLSPSNLTDVHIHPSNNTIVLHRPQHPHHHMDIVHPIFLEMEQIN